jgi:hypothetical protein
MTQGSFAVCRFGGLVLGHDADEMRANRLSNGDVGCIFCGIRGPSIFDALLNPNGENTGTVRRQDSRLDHRYGFQYERGQAWASLTFDSPKQFDDKLEVGNDFGEQYRSPAPEAKLPAVIDKIATRLTELGFRQTGSHATNTMGTIIMVLGRRIVPNKDALDGVRVELSWLY